MAFLRDMLSSQLLDSTLYRATSSFDLKLYQRPAIHPIQEYHAKHFLFLRSSAQCPSFEPGSGTQTGFASSTDIAQTFWKWQST